MFGFIYSIFASIAAFVGYAKDCQENNENRIKFKSKDGLTYIDTKGNHRLISNNEKVLYTYINGDYVIINKHGQIYKNLSEEKRQNELKERIKIARINHETTYAISTDKHKHDWYCKGVRYKDFETGEIYVIRKIKEKYYYLNIVNGMIVRRTDWQIKEDEKYKNHPVYQRIYAPLHYLNIDEFNKKQSLETDKYSLFRNWEYTDMCNLYK